MTDTTIVKIVPKDNTRYYGYDAEGNVYDMKLTNLTDDYMAGWLNTIMKDHKDSPFNKKDEEYTYLHSDIAILRRQPWAIFWFHNREYKPQETI